jgi:hypothetical protein
VCRQEAVSAGLVLAVVMIAGALSGPGNAAMLGFALVVGLAAATIDIGLVRRLCRVPCPSEPRSR